MKKSLLGLVLMFLVCMCFANNGVAAQKVAGSGNNNVAVVDVEAIVKELPEAIEADKQLKEIGQKYQDSLVKMQQALETKVQNYQNQGIKRRKYKWETDRRKKDRPRRAWKISTR